jgi:hypothetical protein
MRAFSSGCVALTGTEAVSNGIPAFRPPESHNAGVVLVWMATILATTFLGITYLTHVYHVIPRETETVVSILARQIFGENLLYYNIQAATAMILLLAANTSFADFPRLSSIMARDGFMPRQLSNRGDKLVFSNGILILAGLSILLLVIFRGSTHALIPLYAVGVFLSFTLSQAGMVRHWLKEEHPAAHHIALNGLGAIATGIVTLVIAISKFTLGAWMVIVLVPVIVAGLLRVSHTSMSDPGFTGGGPPRIGKNPVVVLVAGIHKGVVEALEYAKSISPNVTALTVDLTQDVTPPPAVDRMGAGRSPRGPGISVPVRPPAALGIHRPHGETGRGPLPDRGPPRIHSLPLVGALPAQPDRPPHQGRPPVQARQGHCQRAVSSVTTSPAMPSVGVECRAERKCPRDVLYSRLGVPTTGAPPWTGTSASDPVVGLRRGIE